MKFNRPVSTILAITIDLDDTLWNNAPVLIAAEQDLQRIIEQRFPRVLDRFPQEKRLELRKDLKKQEPEKAKSTTWLRKTMLEVMLSASGYDSTYADDLLMAFLARRNEVALFPGVLDVLAYMSERVPLLALTNGNADIAKMPIRPFFSEVINPDNSGLAKPDQAMFEKACERLSFESEEILHIGDHWDHDILPALSLGMHAAWFNPEKAHNSAASQVSLEFHSWQDLLHALQSKALKVGK